MQIDFKAIRERFGNFSKEVRDGVLVYSATGKPVF